MGANDYRGPDRLAMLNPLQPVESRLTLPFLLLWHSNDRNNRLRMKEVVESAWELLLPAEIVGSPAESHRQQAVVGDHARGLEGGRQINAPSRRRAMLTA